MKEVKYEDLKEGMKIKLKPLEECLIIDEKGCKIYENMFLSFGRVHTILQFNNIYMGGFILLGEKKDKKYYKITWIESIVDEEPTGVINPNHYTKGGIECIDAIKAATIGKRGIEAVCVANVIKYLWRYEDKGAIVDVQKAQWYIEKLIQEISD
tara:strand:- start:2636 stop:3097 length:462 start_codon:yes stop_codon:yes gene_type:complete